jgi:uncharacterized protein
MNDRTESNAPAQHWLIAAWPGMAGVAQTSAAHLIHTLGLKAAGELAPHDHFDIQFVQVKDGLIGKPRLPKNVFFTGLLPNSKTKLTVFIGEAQPAAQAYGFAHELLARAKEMGVDRLATFASLATQLHPSDDPEVFAAGTHKELIKDANAQGVKTLVEAQIGGLNGVLLGAAMHRGIPGVCLLGEIPFFAGQIQNPKAAKGVLQAFGRISGVTIDTTELDAQAKKVDAVLLDLLESMQSGQAGQQSSATAPEFEVGEASDEEIARSAEDELPSKTERPELNLAARERIEKLFEAARKDRSMSVALKRELDAHGVFAKYEDRFLDLFRQTD